MQAVIADIYAGRQWATRPSSPTTRWPITPESSARTALSVLRRVDRQIGRIAAAARGRAAAVPLVVLSDHGQSQGETFLDRYGISLEELVERACDAEDVRAEHAQTNKP